MRRPPPTMKEGRVKYKDTEREGREWSEMRGMHVLRILSCIVDRYTQASPWVIVDNRASLSPSHLPPSPSPRHSLTDWPFASCSTWIEKFQLPRFFLEEVRDRGWGRMSNLLLQLDTPLPPHFLTASNLQFQSRSGQRQVPSRPTNARSTCLTTRPGGRSQEGGREPRTHFTNDEVGFEGSTFKAF